MLRTVLLYGLYYIYRLLDFAILAYCILSWIAGSNYKLYKIYSWLGKYLEPIFTPVRKLMYRLNINLPFDLSPWITMILLGFVYRILTGILFNTFVARF